MQQARRGKDEPAGSETVSDKSATPSTSRQPARPKRSSERSSERATKPAARTRKTGGAKASDSKKTSRGKSARKTPKKDWGKGDECTLSRGLFAGKKGIIVDTPSKGYAKVKVGVIEVNVSVLELDL